MNTTTLTTPRLVLRPLALDDAAALWPTYANADVARYLPWPPHASIHTTRAVLAQWLNPAKACWWTIWLRDAAGDHNGAIGNVGYLGNAGAPGMGYVLHQDYWGHGYMREAVEAALDFGFGKLGLDRVELWIQRENVPSQRLAHRLGFALRGRFSQKYDHQDVAHEKLVYGLYDEDWRSGQFAHPPHPARAPAYSVQPILAVKDVAATATFYRDQLGFNLDWLYGEPPTHGAVSLADWTMQGAHIQLSQSDAITPELARAMALYIFVGAGLEDLYERYRSSAVASAIENELALQPWGMREFAIRDCNGYLLRFGRSG
jgi:ribosomal-protein-alanine N-acetyltransferase